MVLFLLRRCYMFIPLIKNIVIFYMCFYSYNKICKISKHTFNFFLPYVFFSLLLGLETYIFKASVPELSYFAPAVTLFVCISILNKDFSHTNFCISLTSLTLNLLIFQLIALIVACIFAITLHSSTITYIKLPI